MFAKCRDLQSYSSWYVDLPQCCQGLIFCKISEPSPVTTYLISLPSPFTRTAQSGSQFASLQISSDASNQEQDGLTAIQRWQIHVTLFVYHFKGRDRLGDLGIDVRIILNGNFRTSV